jgi:hypothetical protein
MEEYMYPYSISIDASRAKEDQQWRILRIYMIIGYAQAFADLDNNSDFYNKIESINDYKGSLTITWKTEPSDNEKDYLQKAWRSIVTDYEGNLIEHKISG